MFDCETCSELGGVELRVTLGHLSLFVVVVHLGQGVPVVVEMLGRLVPPDGEVLLDRAAQVRAVRCRLYHDLMEGLVRALPVGRLHVQEKTDRHGRGQAKDLVVGGRAQNWAHKRVRGQPAEAHREHRLADDRLKLTAVEFLHLNDFPLGQIVILQVK